MGFNAETEGRVARAEISVYDAMLAEILGEHIAEKCRVRNRRERAKQDKLRSKTYLRIIAEVKPDAELIALNDWLKYA